MRAFLGKLGEKTAPYVLLAPFLFTLVIFFGYAFVRVLYFSFTDYNLFATPNWVGVSNYLRLFANADFTRALRNSLMFMIIVTSGQTMLALLLAVVLNQKLRGIRYFRAAYYMPSVASSVVVTLIFIWFFQRRGVLNYLLTVFQQHAHILLFFSVLVIGVQAALVGWEQWRKRPVSFWEPSYLFLSVTISALFTFFAVRFGLMQPKEIEAITITWFNTRRAWPEWDFLAIPIPLAAIMIFNTWTTAPTFMLLYLAGLQDIPSELYEAAAVDGAKRWHVFRYIIVPQLKPITFLVVTMGLIGTLQMFDQVAILGEQAPLDSVITLAYYVYVNMFPSSATPRVGLASAGAVFLACFTLVIVLIQKRIVKE